YYLALFTQVDLEAARDGLAGLPPDRLPRLGAVMRHGWVFLIPLAVLVYTLMIANWEAGRAGMAAALATFAVGALRAETRPSPARLLASIEETGRTMLDIAVITALAGLVIGTLNLSGFIFKISLLLVSISGGHAFVLLVLTALGCLFLGLPLPTTVVYITLAVLVGPALTQVGIVPLAAHLFLFYFGMISLITPPDCLPTYTAAAIARADFWKTGWAGTGLGHVAHVVPLRVSFPAGADPRRQPRRDRAGRDHRHPRRGAGRGRLRGVSLSAAGLDRPGGGQRRRRAPVRASDGRLVDRSRRPRLHAGTGGDTPGM